MVTDIDASNPPMKVMHGILSRILELDAWKQVENLRV